MGQRRIVKSPGREAVRRCHIQRTTGALQTIRYQQVQALFIAKALILTTHLLWVNGNHRTYVGDLDPEAKRSRISSYGIITLAILEYYWLLIRGVHVCQIGRIKGSSSTRIVVNAISHSRR